MYSTRMVDSAEGECELPLDIWIFADMVVCFFCSADESPVVQGINGANESAFH